MPSGFIPGGPLSATERLNRTFGRLSPSEFDRTIQDLAEYLENRMERRLAEMADFTAEDEVYQKLAARIGVLKAERNSAQASVVEKDNALAAASGVIADQSAKLAELQGTLDNELANRAAEIKRQVDEALALDAQKDLERAGALLEAASDEIPADVPVVETPEAGEPAEVPTDNAGDPVFEPVDESSLPATDVVPSNGTDGMTPVPDEQSPLS